MSEQEAIDLMTDEIDALFEEAEIELGRGLTEEEEQSITDEYLAELDEDDEPDAEPEAELKPE